jgi:hypothetical protein
VLGRAVRPIEGPVICTNKTRKYERGGNRVCAHRFLERERKQGQPHIRSRSRLSGGIVEKIEVE